LEQQSFVEELKGESDYRARFVQELTAAIKDENSKKTNASGDDADIEVAMAEAAVQYYQGILDEQTEVAAVALEEYTENKTRFDTEVARYNERKAINEEQSLLQASWTQISNDYFILDTLRQVIEIIPESDEFDRDRQNLQDRINRLQSDVLKTE
jgi:hypothetical protein